MHRCTCTTGGELGIALSGGGARAMAQLGVLKVLDRAGIPVSYVAGTSAGAVIGAVYSTSDTARQAEERVLAHLATTGVGFNIETFNTIAASSARRPTGFLGMLGTLRRAARPGGGLIGGEIVPLENPSAIGPGTPLRVRCLVGGWPVANQMVLWGGEQGARTVAQRGTRTDPDGVAEVTLDATGRWYIKFVHMVRATEQGLDYESRWATLTFEVR